MKWKIILAALLISSPAFAGSSSISHSGITSNTLVITNVANVGHSLVNLSVYLPSAILTNAITYTVTRGTWTNTLISTTITNSRCSNISPDATFYTLKGDIIRITTTSIATSAPGYIIRHIKDNVTP